MTKKSKFLKSAKLAIAGVVLTSGLAACGMMGEKHKCKSSETKTEKSGCSSKHSCSTKDEKANCSAAKEGKANCSAAKEEKASCAAKEGKASCSSKKKK